MLCWTKGVSICPHTFGCHPVCLDVSCMFRCHHMFGCTPCMFECPCMFGYPHMFGHPLYVWMPSICLAAPVCLDAPIYLDTPYMFGCPPVCLDAPCLHPHMFGCPLYVWVPLCLDTLCMVGCPHMFGHPLYVWKPSICLAAPCMFGCCQMYGGIQRYEGYPNIWGLSKHTGASKCMGAYGHPFSLTKHAFFVLYMYSRHPNIFPTCGGIQTYGSIHTYSGGIQT